MSHHHAAFDFHSKRSRLGFGYSLQSRLSSNQYEREALVLKIKLLEEYEPHISAAIDGPTKFVVGKGIFPFPMTGSDEYKKDFKEKFMNWAKNSQICDKGGKFNWVKMQKMADRSRRAYGESFIFYQSSVNDFPQFQIVDPLLVRSGSSNRNNVRDGIRFDSNDRPLGCYVSNAKISRFDTSTKFFARNLYAHIANYPSAHHLRGRTPFHNSATVVHDLLDLLTSEKDAHATHLGLAAHIKKKRQSTYNMEDNFDENDEIVEEEITGEKPEDKEQGFAQIRGATMVESPDIEEVKLLSSNRQTAALKDLVELCLRQVSYSCGYTYEFLFDLSSLGGVTARIDLESNYKAIENEQNDLIDEVLYPFVRFWVAKMIKEGRLEDPPEDFFKIGFRCPAKATADIKHNGKNARENIDYRLVTRSETIEDTGRSYEDFVRQNIEDIELEKRLVEESSLEWEEYTETIKKSEQKPEPKENELS